MRLFSLFLAAAVAGCSTPFEVELPAEDPRVVIESLFAADSLITLTLDRSEPLFRPDSGETDQIADATVRVYEDGVEVGRAVYVPNRSRYVSQVRARAGRTYRVRVEAPGLAPAEAEDTVPLPRPFTVEVTRGPDPDRDRLDEVVVRFSDPAGPDFYALYGLAERRYVDPRFPPQVFPLTFRSTDPALADGSLEQLVTEVDDPFYLRAFFSDRPFDGTRVEIRLRVARLGDGSDQFEAFDRLRLAVPSPLYYRYQRALAQGNTPLDDVVRVPSNVEGGYGIFAAFAASERVLP